MKKIIAIYKDDLEMLAFVWPDGGTINKEVVSSYAKEAIDLLTEEIIKDNNGKLPIRGEVNDQASGNIIITMREVGMDDHDYIYALCSAARGAGLMAVVVLEDAKQLLIDLGNRSIPKEEKSKIFAELVNMEEDELAQIYEIKKEIAPLAKELEDLEVDWEKTVEAIKAKK